MKYILAAIVEIIAVAWHAVSFWLFWNWGASLIFPVPQATYLQCLAIAIAIFIVACPFVGEVALSTMSKANGKDAHKIMIASFINVLSDCIIHFGTAIAGIMVIRMFV